jgi:hypothetical protein
MTYDEESDRESFYDTGIDGLATFGFTYFSASEAIPAYTDLATEGVAQYGNSPEELMGIVMGVATVAFGRRTLENTKKAVEDIEEYLEE